MTKKPTNQNDSYNLELVNSIESNFIFDEKPINRLNNYPTILKEENGNKEELLTQLRNEINSIKDCSLKKNSQNLVLGNGNINSPIMLIGEAPGVEDDKSGTTFVRG